MNMQHTHYPHNKVWSVLFVVAGIQSIGLCLTSRVVVVIKYHVVITITPRTWMTIGCSAHCWSTAQWAKHRISCRLSFSYPMLILGKLISVITQSYYFNTLYVSSTKWCNDWFGTRLAPIQWLFWDALQVFCMIIIQNRTNSNVHFKNMQ